MIVSHIWHLQEIEFLCHDLVFSPGVMADISRVKNWTIKALLLGGVRWPSGWMTVSGDLADARPTGILGSSPRKCVSCHFSFSRVQRAFSMFRMLTMQHFTKVTRTVLWIICCNEIAKYNTHGSPYYF